MKILLSFLILILSISSSIAQIPTDNLILLYPFNGGALDMSPSDLDGTVLGATLTEDRNGFFESAYDFNGIDNYISVPSDPVMDVEFPFSISLWYYRSDPADGIEMLFKSDANDDVYSGFWINMAATGEVVAAYGDGLGLGEGHRISKRSSSAISIGEWHHVLAVFNDLEDIDLYIDCELDPGHYSGSASTMGYLGENTTIGRYDWRIFDGKIDDIRIYSDAITEEEIPLFCEDSCIDLTYLKVPISLCGGEGVFVFGDYITTAGVYYDSLTSITGCDSIIRQDVYVGSFHETTPDPIVFCHGDSVEVFGTFVDEEGIYTDTFLSIYGCDSTVIQTVFELPINTTTNTPLFLCSGDSVEVFGSIVKGDGIYIDTLISINGCDSIVQQTVFELPINNTTNEPLFLCWQDSVEVFGNYVSMEGTYYDTLTSVLGCDSIIIQNVFINDLITTTLDPITICFGDSVEVFGNSESNEGLYSNYLSSYMDCDSIIYQHVYVLDEINSEVIISGTFLTSSHPAASYQWINCKDGSPILGEINQFFEPIDNGEYAVIITDNECIDTSDCYRLQELKIDRNDGKDYMFIYPNPANNSATINISNIDANMSIKILDLTGKEILTRTINSNVFSFSTQNLSSGVYLVHLIKQNHSIEKVKLIVHH